MAMVLFAATEGFGADQTWTGAIGDSHCGTNLHGTQFTGSVREFAAHTVRVTGEMSGDTITVKRIAPAK